LLKIVLVKLNYRIGVHINFAQSTIPALVCSLQSEYVATSGKCHPQFECFQANKIFEV